MIIIDSAAVYFLDLYTKCKENSFFLKRKKGLFMLEAMVMSSSCFVQTTKSKDFQYAMT